MFLVRTLIGKVIVAGLIVVVAVAAGWWFFIREDAKLAENAPAIPQDLKSPSAAASPTAVANGSPATATRATASASAAASAAASAPAGATAFTIVADRSKASYFAGEKLARLSLPSTAQGSTKQVSGIFYLASSGLAGGPTSTFTVDLRTLRSDEGMRDRRVQDTLQTAQFPLATFVATKVEGFPATLSATTDSAPFKMTGALEVHGVKKEVTWEVKLKRDANVMTGLATVKIRYNDFGMSPPNIAGFVTVNDDLTLQMEIVATAA